jgi:hypothetical protein
MNILLSFMAFVLDLCSSMKYPDTEEEAKQVIKTLREKVNNFLDKNRSKLLVVLILCICFVVGFVIGSLLSSDSKEKKLAEIEQITYELTNESAE